MTTPSVDPRVQAEPLMRLAVETLRLAPPDMESPHALSEEERGMLLAPFMAARERDASQGPRSPRSTRGP